MTKSYGITDKTAQTICEQAEHLVKDKFLKSLRDEYRSGKLIEFAMCHQLNENSTDYLMEICKKTRNEFTNIFEGLGKNFNSTGNNLPQTIKNIEDLIVMRPSERGFALRKTKSTVLDYHISGVSFKLAQSTRMKADEVKIRTEVKKLIGTFECQTEYDEISKISSQFHSVRSAFNFYSPKPHQALIASYITKQTTKVVSVQVDYGHGKTYVILMAVKRHIDIGIKKVLILVLNEALVKQMNDSITMLELPSNKITVRTYTNLPTEIPDIVFIDEAYDIMMKSLIKFNTKGEVAGLLGVPNKATQTIFMSGVKSNQMPSLLDSLYGEENYSHMNFGSTNKLIDKGDFNLCSVMCDNDFSVVTRAAIKQVVKVAEEGPVIVFGMEDHIGEIKGQT